MIIIIDSNIVRRHPPARKRVESNGCEQMIPFRVINFRDRNCDVLS